MMAAVLADQHKVGFYSSPETSKACVLQNGTMAQSRVLRRLAEWLVALEAIRRTVLLSTGVDREEPGVHGCRRG
jgi:hypothetical protein